MGYYSEIAIKLNKKALDKAPEEVRNFLEENFECVAELEYGGKVFLTHYMKWYDDFPEVQKTEEFLESLEDENDELYEFLRIGEDEDDTEHRYNTECSSMWVDRSINYESCIPRETRK